MNVEELMRVHVNSGTLDSTFTELADIMDLYQVTFVPIVDRFGLLLGVVTESALVHAVVQLTAASVDGPTIGVTTCIERKTACRDIMDSQIPAVDIHDGVDSTLRTMFVTKLPRLPVTNDGKLVGTISWVDICQSVLAGDLVLPPDFRTAE